MKTICVGAAALAFSLAAVAPASATPLTRDCKLAGVAAFSSRVHVRCANDPHWGEGSALYPGNPLLARVDYFAVDLNSPLATHVTWLGNWALVNGRTVTIFFDFNPAPPGSNIPGCKLADCARLTGIEVH